MRGRARCSKITRIINPYQSLTNTENRQGKIIIDKFTIIHKIWKGHKYIQTSGYLLQKIARLAL